MQVRRRIILLLWSLIILGCPAHAQQHELDILVQKPSSEGVGDSGWYARLDVTTFLRDAEFSAPQTPGYTAVGFFAEPTLNRRIGGFGHATFGLHLASAAGYQGLHTWQPLVRLECTPHQDVRLVMGTLYGGLSHGLYEPMFDRERYIYAHQEEGVQLLAYIRSLRWRTDTWLHWENLLEPWQMDQERFTLATSNVITPIDGKHFQISVPFSFLGSHRGGQFSALDTCIESLFTESVGLTLNVLVSGFKFQVSAPWFFYQDISPVKCQAYDNGYGFWPQMTIDYRKEGFRLLGSAGYWLGHQYIAPRGGYLFQSVSWDDPDFRQPDRRMATARLALEYSFTDDFRLGADAEAYYDLNYRRADIAFGLYLRYTPTINL